MGYDLIKKEEVYSMQYLGAALIIGIIVFVMIRTALQNKKIRENGIVTEAVVSRIEEEDHTDGDGIPLGTIYDYYVTYRTIDGMETEARLGSGKPVDNQMTTNHWASDLYVGCPLTVMYDPANPGYAIRVREE